MRLKSKNKANPQFDLFGQIFKISPLPIAITNLDDGSYLDINQSFIDYTGYSRQALLGQNSEGLGIRLTPQSRREILETLKKQGHYHGKEVKLKTKSGKVVDTSVTIEPTIWRGRPAILTIYYDITEKKQIQEQLKERLETLEQSRVAIRHDQAQDETILSSIGEGIVATDASGCVIIFNPQAEAITGINKEEALGKHVSLVIPLHNGGSGPEHTERRPLTRVLQGQVKKYIDKTGKYYFQRSDGAKIPLALTVTPVLERGKITGAVQVFRDITVEKEMDRAKSEIISLASHQLRTPLSAINWYTEVLLKGDLGRLNKEQKKYLYEVSQANQKMIELVYDFLNVSRIELGTFSLKLARLNLKEIADGVINELKPLILEKRLKIIKKITRRLPLILGDHKLIRIIMQNLVTNAVKYTPSRGTVKVSLSRKQAEILFNVKDTGYGIPEEAKPQIFHKLFRADNIKDKEPGGSGLGLYIVKSFVDFSGGKIWFNSKVGSGSTFFVTLPIK